MYAKRHTLSLEFEMLRWLVVLALACILALAVASSAAGRDVVKRPPGALTDLAKPMPSMSVLENDQTFADEEELVRHLWTALALHQGHDPAAAREIWHSIQLPRQTEAWQYLAIGVTYLQEADSDGAAAAFQVAKSLQPDNPVASYFMGIVRLTQAQTAEVWRDVPMNRNEQFIRWDGNMNDVVPNSKAMYEWVAMAEFTRAIELAHHAALDTPLVATSHFSSPSTTETPNAPPQVGDLLDALGARNFAGKAHHTLGAMLVSRGALETAEAHFDEAAKTGLAIAYGYADLGAALEANGEHSDAFRVFMKAVANGDRSQRTTHGVLENFGKALFNF